MPRIRNAKSIAQRIDLQYFTRRHGFRRWRFLLSLAVPLALGAWLLGAGITRNQNVYTSGPMSSAHAVFGKNCALCHVRAANFRAHVEDKACLTCHDAPTHTPKQTFTPTCSSCHVEHQGKMRLAATADNGCTQCHSNLHTTDGQIKYDAHVSGFDSKHPQFLPLRPGQGDPGTINLNHYVHLQPTLRGPRGQVQMVCDDCHRATGVNEAWPYSVAVVQPATQQPVLVSETEAQQRKRKSIEVGAGAYMTQIKYVNQCAACHVLQFDPLITEPAPHDKPEKVHAFIVQKLTEYIGAHPEALRQNIPLDNVPTLAGPEPQLQILRPTRAPETTPTPPMTATSPTEWVNQRAARAERLLWSKNCRVCHASTQREGEGLPTSVKAIIPTRWLPNSEFDHQAHRMMSCVSCHTTIPRSKLTSDVNLPGIDTCRQCHKEAGPAKQAADGGCFECHAYHDWRKEKRTTGKFDVAQIRAKYWIPNKTPSTPPPATPEDMAPKQ